ncbi:hypothetical protein, partial [Salmonella enterica]
GMSASATQTGGAAPAVLAGRLIDGGVFADPNGDTITWRERGFAIAVRVPAGKSPNDAEIAVVIDDDDSALSMETRDLWREWLR